MKILLLAFVFTACGADKAELIETHSEITLAAQYEGDVILTEGAALRTTECSFEWPISLPYTVDADGNFRSGESVYGPVQGQEKTWAFGVRQGKYNAITTFTMQDGAVFVALDCYR